MPIKQNLNLNQILTPGEFFAYHLPTSSLYLRDIIISRPELGQDFVFEHVRYFRSVSFVVEVILSVLLVLVEDVPGHLGTEHHGAELGVGLGVEPREPAAGLAPHHAGGASTGLSAAMIIIIHIIKYIFY